jgi:hypothetical protein
MRGVAANRRGDSPRRRFEHAAGGGNPPSAPGLRHHRRGVPKSDAAISMTSGVAMTQGNSIGASSEQRPRRGSLARARFAMLGAAALALIAASAQAQSPQRFDLACSGAVTRTIDDDSTNAAWTGTMRVDLVRSRLCLDDCLDARGVVEDRSAMIESLSVGKESLTPQRVEFVDKVDVDRRSGRFYREHDWAENRRAFDGEELAIIHHDVYSGACSVAEFTGFPRRLF